MNTFPGLVHTARHVTKVGNTRSRWPNPLWEGAVEGGTGDKEHFLTGLAWFRGQYISECLMLVAHGWNVDYSAHLIVFSF